AVAAGSATITATSGTAKATCAVTVTAGGVGNGLTVTLANFPALATVGGYARVDSGAAGVTPVGLARTGTSTFVAYSLVCTHQGTTIAQSSVGWTCPNHGAEFSSTGALILGPATTALTSFPCTYNATAGTVTIGGATAKVGSVKVSPTTTTLAAGQSTQCTATVYDTTGAVMAGQAVTWTSSNTAVATISSGLIM